MPGIYTKLLTQRKSTTSIALYSSSKKIMRQTRRVDKQYYGAILNGLASLGAELLGEKREWTVKR